MKVCIDDVLTVECSHLLNAGETWNGFVQPVFTAEQLDRVFSECVRLGWFDSDGVGANKESTFGRDVEDLGDGAFLLSGWTWDLAEDLTCDDCGRGIYTEGCGC